MQKKIKYHNDNPKNKQKIIIKQHDTLEFESPKTKRKKKKKKKT